MTAALSESDEGKKPRSTRQTSRPVPTARLAIAAAALSVALSLALSPPWGFVIAYGALGALAFADWAFTTAPRRIAVSRELPASIVLGESGTVGWDVANRGPRKARIAIADGFAPSLGARTRRARMSLAPQERSRAETVIRPSRRGDFTPSEVVVRVEGPLGLMSRQGARQEPQTIRVFPPFRSRKEAELRIDRARLLEVGMRSAAARGGGTEFEQLRDYVVDDEFRRIDWAATARAGRPIVKTFRAERNQTVIALVDNGRTMAGRVAGVPRIEHAMDAAMALTAVATRTGDRIGMIVFDRSVRASLPASQSQSQFARVVNALYRLEPELAESDYRGAFTEMLVRFRRRALVVILTELADQSLQDTLLRDLPLITRSHLVMVGSVRDPDVQGWAESSPADAGSAYRKAAAISALEDRHALSLKLSGLGATVVDAAPGKLAGRLIDAYLDAKAAGRL